MWFVLGPDETKKMAKHSGFFWSQETDFFCIKDRKVVFTEKVLRSLLSRAYAASEIRLDPEPITCYSIEIATSLYGDGTSTGLVINRIQTLPQRLETVKSKVVEYAFGGGEYFKMDNPNADLYIYGETKLARYYTNDPGIATHSHPSHVDKPIFPSPEDTKSTLEKNTCIVSAFIPCFVRFVLAKYKEGAIPAKSLVYLEYDRVNKGYYLDEDTKKKLCDELAGLIISGKAGLKHPPVLVMEQNPTYITKNNPKGMGFFETYEISK